MTDPSRSNARRMLMAVAATLVSASVGAGASDLPIYTDSLSADWADWSWGVTRNLANAAPAHNGVAAIAVTVTAGWSALYLHANTGVNTAPYEQLRFWVNGGASGGQKLQLVANGNGNQTYSFSPSANAWTLVSVPMAALGNPVILTDLYWQDSSGGVQAAFFLDDITLVAGTGTGRNQPPVAGPDLSIDASADRRAISPDIYGINFLDEALAVELRLPVRRWGGNSTSRYNWQNDTSNTGNDWYFENIPYDNANPATLPDGSASDRFVEQDRRTGTRSLLTVPTIGWVAKRRTGGHPYDCGFRVSKYGAQQSTDQWDADCGNGKAANGSNLTGNDPTDTSIASDPSFVAQWINHLVGKYGTAANGGVSYYAFDNEPMIWNSTHRDVHPQAPTYDEMRDRTYLYGAAVKAADPSAKTLGPVEWGWCAYLYSGADNCAPGADYQAHASIHYAAWYLQQMRAYEQQHSVRILDYFDLHAYPYASGVSLSPAGDASTQALRLRSIRGLWDPAYIDESWVSDTVTGGVAIQLIPRMKKWVADNYPETKLAISEYNWGANESINGALAQADALGIFGREGLDLATYWGDVVATQPLTFAFRMYRNYDGAGRGFGDTAVRSTSADQGKLAVYSSQNSADGALTIMVINKSASDLTSSVGLAGFNPGMSAAVYRYSPANLAAIEHAADQAVSASGFTATFPADSITLFVLAAAGQATYAVQSGWNLLGNSHTQSLLVSALFGNASWVSSVWKWDAVQKHWQFYAPSLNAGDLQTFANDRGYGVLGEIQAGAGYWVHATAPAAVTPEPGSDFDLTAANLVTGWNLVATGTTVTPSAFNANLKSSLPGTGLTTLWAWDNPRSAWYFYSPSLEAQGSTALTDYIAGKGYLDFSSNSKTLGNGTGFWVNR